MSRSVVEFFKENEGYRCGYCRRESSRFSHGMWGHLLTTRDYQDLIDRGWRRSGQYCYKPINSKCCCPMYTIRCEALSFKPSHSHKKTLRKFRNYVEHGKAPQAGGGTGSPAPTPGEPAERMDAAVEERMAAAEERLTLSETPSVPTADSLRSSDRGDEPPPVRAEQEQQSSRSGSSPHPRSEPGRMKGKLFRRERWRKKQAEKGMVVEPKVKNQEKSLEDWLSYTSDSLHKFEVRLVPADPDDPLFVESFEESLSVYQKYQVAVHGDPLDKCNSSQYKRFLCKNPLMREGRFGAFHRQYLLDGRIVAVGVVDILPYSVSSVYLYYDPAFSFLSLGTYTSLSEIAFVRELSRSQPSTVYYYLGFYIHSCQKMKYKGQFSPSYLCCPESYTWHPIEVCRPLLDSTPYCRLDPSPSSADRNAFKSINDVKVLYCRQMLRWEEYLDVCVREDGREVEDEVEEVEEYGTLVGNSVVSRMLLYRPN